MSLKAFHVVFIAAALVLAGWTGRWSWNQWQSGAEGGWLALAAACAAAMVALVVYGVWFLKKTRGVSYL
jgi:hypothetical protein